MMTNNEIIKRLRFILDVDDSVLMQCFELGDCHGIKEKVASFLLPETNAAYQLCTDEHFTRFLDGLIIYRRGPAKNGSRNPVALTNNMILKKVRIALELEARDLDHAFMLADCELSPHEISALFRKPGTKHFTECSDSILERFFSGLSLYFRS
jgi:uncharacterized protein YehS (DUF1456 family)